MFIRNSRFLLNSFLLYHQNQRVWTSIWLFKLLIVHSFHYLWPNRCQDWTLRWATWTQERLHLMTELSSFYMATQHLPICGGILYLMCRGWLGNREVLSNKISERLRQRQPFHSLAHISTRSRCHGVRVFDFQENLLYLYSDSSSPYSNCSMPGFEWLWTSESCQEEVCP